MQILSAEQHRALDQATIQNEGISSLELMERAATAFAQALMNKLGSVEAPVTIVCGTGNNGGDGLVAARILHQKGYSVKAYLAPMGNPTADNVANHKRAEEAGVPVHEIKKEDPLFGVPPDAVVIDALFGTGLSRPVTGYLAQIIEHLNSMANTRYALDLPSGLFADAPAAGVVFCADHTFTLGYPKLALFSQNNTNCVGSWEIVSFDLANDFAEQEPGNDRILNTSPDMKSLLRTRRPNDHKGTFGHALMIAGSYGKMGAAIIAGRGVLQAGAGLLTYHTARCGYEILQISLPEAMVITDEHEEHIRKIGDLSAYKTIGIGPGIGQAATTATALSDVLRRFDQPMVIDADALNILSNNSQWLELIPAGSILTPHPKEFERLFGESTDDFQRWETQREAARILNAVVLLKTGYTSIATPDGKLYFNHTGNPGMGTGGTGDALTGILTGLLAQGYPSADAARLGVYLHGLAGDIAAEQLGQESLLAEDLVNMLGQAYQRLREVV
ncbi:NAD(P)H-hydrate dehydratase [Neolewinella aurantiaca]|uniref:Bifunctional NAD(P)H-hydrate repair enzyme n=1 Tax=Neolewinella aurantiaca TaxID=2602767 RepID=A0A5C7FPQ9_9BACT|nr:NAD(P)H-hydrate dehydratase [Neolewinella aurantiaca]TXF89708.1 NAD(P)H-hydrate dehydratase [Neolewinella aurantiaca]